MFTELKGKDYYERLRYLNLCTLEERRNRQDLIGVFKMHKGFTNMDIRELQRSLILNVLGTTL